MLPNFDAFAAAARDAGGTFAALVNAILRAQQARQVKRAMLIPPPGARTGVLSRSRADRSRHTPHQGQRERARRKRQARAFAAWG